MDPDPSDLRVQESPTELQSLLPPTPQDESEQVQTHEREVRIQVTRDEESPWNECRKQLLGIQLLRAVKDGNTTEVER